MRQKIGSIISPGRPQTPNRFSCTLDVPSSVSMFDTVRLPAMPWNLQRAPDATAVCSEEERQWQERGVTFGRAMPWDSSYIQQTLVDHAGELDNILVEYEEFITARRGDAIIAFGRIHRYEDHTLELASLFVEKEERGQRLGCTLVRMLLSAVQEEDVFAIIDPKLQRYYALLGFHPVHTFSESLTEKNERLARLYPDEPLCIVLLREARRGAFLCHSVFLETWCVRVLKAAGAIAAMTLL